MEFSSDPKIRYIFSSKFFFWDILFFHSIIASIFPKKIITVNIPIEKFGTFYYREFITLKLSKFRNINTARET